MPLLSLLPALVSGSAHMKHLFKILLWQIPQSELFCGVGRGLLFFTVRHVA